jgi:hypothetical protein
MEYARWGRDVLEFDGSKRDVYFVE